MSSINWGWRIGCETPGCKRKVEEWSPLGVPSLPGTGMFTSGPLSGWFVAYRGHGGYIGELPPGPENRHVAYCSEHAGPALAWFAEYAAWKKTKSQVGRETHEKHPLTAQNLGLVERVADWLDPIAQREARERHRQLAIWDAVRLWTAEHPEPKPPWLRPPEKIVAAS